MAFAMYCPSGMIMRPKRRPDFSRWPSQISVTSDLQEARCCLEFRAAINLAEIDMSAPKTALRLYANDSGASCLETFEISRELRDFAPPAAPLWASDAEPASGYVVIRLPVGWDGKKHTTPRRQILFGLNGRIRITPDIGEPRLISAGDILRMEDTQGSGHFTEVVSDEPFDGVMVQLPENSNWSRER